MFSAGTVRPNPAPRHAVANRSIAYASDWSEVKNWLMISRLIESRPATSPAR